MSTEVTHLNQALQNAFDDANDKFGTVDANLNLAKTPHTKNISIDDWNTLVDAVEVSTEDVKRLYTLLTDLKQSLEGSLQITVPETPVSSTDASSKGYVQKFVGFENNYFDIRSLKELATHVFSNTAHRVEMSLSLDDSLSASNIDYTLTMSAFPRRGVDVPQNPISTYSISFTEYGTVLIRTALEQVASGGSELLSYRLNEDEMSYSCVGRGEAMLKNLRIASYYKDKPVTRLVSLQDCSDVESLVIPSTVTTIDRGALMGFSSLQRLEIPFIGDGMSNKTPNSVLGYIFGDAAYSGSHGSYQKYDDEQPSKRWYIPVSLKTVVVTGDSATNGAFSNCTYLEHVEFSGNLCEDMFYGCRRLKSVSDLNCSDVPYAAFSGCEALKSVRFLQPLNRIYSGAFQTCRSLESVTTDISGTSSNSVRVSVVESAAFSGCYSLKNIELDNVSHIESSAFGYCKSLRTVTVNIPDTVLKIDQNAFLGCDRLTTFEVFPTGAELNIMGYAFKDCTRLSSFPLESVKNIMAGVFQNCNFKRLDFSNSPVTQINKDAFIGNPLEFVNLGNVPTVYAGAFGNIATCITRHSEKPNNWRDGWGNPDKMYWGCDSFDKVLADLLSSDEVNIGATADKIAKAIIDVAYQSDVNDPKYGTFTFKTFDGNSKEIDLPLELIVSTDPTKSYYDTVTKDLVIGLANGSNVTIPLDDILTAVDDAKQEAVAAKDAAIGAKESAEKAVKEATDATASATLAATTASDAKDAAIAAKDSAEAAAKDLEDAVDTVNKFDSELKDLSNTVDSHSSEITGLTSRVDELSDLSNADNILLGNSVQSAETVYPETSILGGSDMYNVTSSKSIVIGEGIKHIDVTRSIVAGIFLGDERSVSGIRDIRLDTCILAGREFKYDSDDDPELIYAQYSILAGLKHRYNNLTSSIVVGNHLTAVSDSSTADKAIAGTVLAGTGNYVYNSSHNVIGGLGNKVGEFVDGSPNTFNPYLMRSCNAVFGQHNTVNANYSLVVGQSNDVYRDSSTPSQRYVSYCLIAGEGHKACAYHQTLVGKYSAAVGSTMFAVGNGTSKDNRSNAFEIRSANGTASMFLNGVNVSPSAKIFKFQFDGTYGTENVSDGLLLGLVRSVGVTFTGSNGLKYRLGSVARGDTSDDTLQLLGVDPGTKQLISCNVRLSRGANYLAWYIEELNGFSLDEYTVVTMTVYT